MENIHRLICLLLRYGERGEKDFENLFPHFSALPLRAPYTDLSSVHLQAESKWSF